MLFQEFRFVIRGYAQKSEPLIHGESPILISIRSRQKTQAIYLSSLIILGFAAYLQVFNLGFTHWDDDLYVLQNPFIRSLSIPSITAFFSNTFLGNYAPFHLLTYSLDFRMWGLEPTGYHLSNLVWHLFNTVGTFYLISIISRNKNVAWLAAMLFAIHPINVETVAWVSQRKTLIAQAFFTLSFIQYLRFETGHSNKHYYWSLFFFFCSLLSKVSTITLPLLLIMYDTCFLERSTRESLADKIPFFLLSLVFGLISIYAQFVAYGGELHLHGGSLLSNLLTVIVALKRYIFLIFFPFNLSAYYYFSYPSPFTPQVVFSSAWILGILSLLIIFRKEKTVLFWAGWFFISLLPNLHIVPLDAVMGDRYMYLPAVGIFCMMAMVLQKFFAKYGFTTVIGKAALTLIFAFGGMLIVLSHHRVEIWKNDLTLWSETVKTSPSPLAFNNLGAYWGREGDFTKSRDSFEQAIEIDPDNYQANKNLGSLSMMKNDFYNAEIYYKKALSIKPYMTSLKLEMGSMYTDKGDFQKAREILSKIPATSPNYPEAQKKLELIGSR